MIRYSEPYSATGGLAAEGVINQLGRPDIEPLEVLVREAVQNCWDAKRPNESGIRVEIGGRSLDADDLVALKDILVDPPLGLPLQQQLRDGVQTLYFADFGTDGLGGPTRADRPGKRRDFVDFVRNIGQPPDKDLGGGSFGYGKAAFYIASAARTVIIDTLCIQDDGSRERRLIGCALGDNFEENGRPHTGRHWWGKLIDGVPEPVVGDEAREAARRLHLPERDGENDLGTTILIVAPNVAPDSEDGSDQTMAFIAEALAWNFWPRMIGTRGGTRPTMSFNLRYGDTRIRVPDPRTHQRLRMFVEAMDRHREEPGEDDDLLLDRSIDSLRPVRKLGRLVVQKGPVAPADLPERSVPQGARLTADSLHHVALMRNAELVVKYMPGPTPVVSRMGYAGVFKCALDVDDAFRRSEPPTHDDWIYRALPKGHSRSFVKIALERIAGVCREAAGYSTSMNAASDGEGVPLGEFADAMATLMPGFSGPGARRPAATPSRRRARRAPGRTVVSDAASETWVDGEILPQTGADGNGDGGDGHAAEVARLSARPVRAPQARSAGEPQLTIANDGVPVIRYPFELRGYGAKVRLTATVEVMANDGGQVETEPPAGSSPVEVRAWISPAGVEYRTAEAVVDPEDVDGAWTVDVEITDEAMMRVDIRPVAA